MLIPASADATFRARFEAAIQGDLDAVLERAGLTRGALEEAMRTRGEIRAVLVDGEDAGSVWLELRDRTLHVHALLLDESARGHGLGGQILDGLAAEFAERADEIELAVQAGNDPAARLYRNRGFVEVGRREPGFTILRRSLATAAG